MSIIKRAVARFGDREKADAGDIQSSPIKWQAYMDRKPVITKVDHVVRAGSTVLVSGWSSSEGQLRLAADDLTLDTQRFKLSRPDVSRYLGEGHPGELGFVLVAEADTVGSLSLQCLDNAGNVMATYPLRPSARPLSPDARIHFTTVFDQMDAASRAALEELGDTVESTSGGGAGGACAIGVLDEVLGGAGTGFSVASGWAMCRPEVETWLQDSQGRKFPLDGAWRRQRDDVRDAVPAEFSGQTPDAGFMLRLDGVEPGERVRLMARSSEDVMTLSESICEEWCADPHATSRWLFKPCDSLSGLSERISKIDLPVIEALQSRQQRRWPQFPVRTVDVGTQTVEPKVSIIIPLFGRLDFVEHQLMEFARDTWLREYAEVIYVVDDPALVDGLATEASVLNRLYGVPFRWIWGRANRGFAGANNLGVTEARGEYLVFLNSDAFPRQPGWLQLMVTALEDDQELGAVGARLLFADGSLQHSGMTFLWRDDLGIWVNHHPRLGFEPSLDPSDEITEVTCVTGACLAIRRVDLERVGGWDTGYLIGDFEDSDLCMKLRQAGRKIGYLPQVELTHLERQSFKMLGAGDYRTRVVILNAVRHQQRWQETIAEFSASERVR